MALINIDVQKLLDVSIDEIAEVIQSITKRITAIGNESRPGTDEELCALTEQLSELYAQYAKCLLMIPEVQKFHDEIEDLEVKVDSRMQFINGNTITAYNGQKQLDNLIVQVGEKVRRTRISEANRVYSEDIHRYAHFISKDHTSSAPDWWQPTDGTNLDRGFPSKETMNKGHMGRTMRESQDRQENQDPSRFRNHQMLLHQERQVTRVRENGARAEMGLPSKEEEEESAREAPLGHPSLTDDMTNSMKTLRQQPSSIVQSPGGDISRQRAGAGSGARSSPSQPPGRAAGQKASTSSPRGVRSGSRANRVDSPLTSPSTSVGGVRPPSQQQSQRPVASASGGSTRAGGPATTSADNASAIIPMDVEIPHVGEVEHMTSDSSSSFSSGDEASPDK